MSLMQIIMQIILLILSVAPVMIFAHLIYKRDFDKEPTSLLVKLFFCGVGSTILTLIFTKLLTSIVPFFGYETGGLNVIELIPYVFIGVALIEELSKWIFVYFLEYNDNEFNHLYDGIVYAAFVSLGFACLENILYVMQSGIVTAIVRALLAIPGHLCDGIMMGYYLSMAKLAMCNGNKSLSTKNLILSLLIPTLAHGVYDYLIFASSASNNSIFLVAFFIFVAFFYSYAAKKVKQLSLSAYNLNPNYISVTHRNLMAQNRQQIYNYYQQNTSYPQQTNYQYQNQVSYPQNNYSDVQQSVGYTQQPVQQTNNYTQTLVDKKFCPQCGTPVKGKFCAQCGRQL